MPSASLSARMLNHLSSSLLPQRGLWLHRLPPKVQMKMTTQGGNSSSILHLLSSQCMRSCMGGGEGRRHRRRRGRMGVTCLQTDDSVCEGYWIYTPSGNTGYSLNDDKSTLLPGLNKSSISPSTGMSPQSGSSNDTKSLFSWIIIFCS